MYFKRAEIVMRSIIIKANIDSLFSLDVSYMRILTMNRTSINKYLIRYRWFRSLPMKIDITLNCIVYRDEARRGMGSQVP